MDDALAQIVSTLAKLRPSREELAKVMPIYDPATMAAGAEYVNPANMPARARSFAASAPDPMGLTSAAVGTVAPGVRDNWRAVQEESPLGHMAGQMAGATGLMRALPAARTWTGGAVRGGAVGGAPDAIDSAVGNGNLDKNSAMQSILGALLYPVTRRLPGGK